MPPTFKDVQSSHKRWLRRHAKEVKGTTFFWHSKVHVLKGGILCSSSQTKNDKVFYSIWYANPADLSLTRLSEHPTRLECEQAIKRCVKEAV